MEDRISVGPHEEELTVEAFNLDIARGFRQRADPPGNCLGRTCLVRSKWPAEPRGRFLPSFPT